MNKFQSIFLVFFAILWGTSSTVWPKWKPFHWTYIFYSPRVAFRILWSFCMFNILPIAFFIYAVKNLGNIRSDELTTSHLIMSVLPSFVTFGLYRIWAAVVSLFPSMFYYQNDDELQRKAKLDLKCIDPTIDGLKLSGHWWWADALFGILYIAVSTFVLREDRMAVLIQMWTALTTHPRWLTIAGLSLDFAGAIMLASSVIVTKKKAIDLGLPTYAGSTEEENIRHPQVQDRRRQSNALIGIILLALGFCLQIIGNL